MGRSEMCMPCHNLPLSVAVEGRPLLDTWREWAASPYMAAGVQCQHCHMPQGDHRWLGAHDPATVAQSVEVEISTSQVGGAINATIDVSNVGAGHWWPTTATPRGVLRVRLLTAGGEIVEGTEKTWAVGRTMRFSKGQWRTVADTRIPPGERRQWRYHQALGEGAVTLEAELWFFPDWFYGRFFSKRRDDPDPGRQAAFTSAWQEASGRRFRIVHRRLSILEL